MFSKWDQIRRKLRIWSHLLKKPLMEIFIFCAVSVNGITVDCPYKNNAFSKDIEYVIFYYNGAGKKICLQILILIIKHAGCYVLINNQKIKNQIKRPSQTDCSSAQFLKSYQYFHCCTKYVQKVEPQKIISYLFIPDIFCYI